MRNRPLTANLSVLFSLTIAVISWGCDDAAPSESTRTEMPQVKSPKSGGGGGGGAEVTAPSSPSRERPGGSSWPIFRGDAALTGVAPGRLAAQPELLWSFQAEGAIVSSPIAVEGRVYFGSDDGNVYCLKVEGGELVWKYATGFLIEAPPLFHHGMIYIGGNDFFFYALDATTGALVWKYETDEKIAGGANIVQAPTDGGERDLIVAGSHDALVYAFDAKTGEKVWTYETNDRVNATLAVVDNDIIFGGCDTVVYVLDGATGEAKQRIELGGECHIAASVGVAGRTVYFGHHANEFVALDLDAGDVTWRYSSPRFGFFSPPAITADRVVFGGRDLLLHCVDRATGEVIWTFPTRRKIDSGPVICDGKVVVGSGDGRLYLVDLQDGAELWSYDIGKSVYSSPAVVDGTILVGANDGRLYAFGAAATETPEEP